MNNSTGLSSFAIQNGFCRSVNPLGTNKEQAHNYLSNVYEEIFSHFQINKLLEIGLMYGASIRLWQSYLGLDKCIGIDNGNQVQINDFANSSNNIKIILGDAFSAKIQNSLDNDFDLIIEDANHTMYQQSKSSSLLTKKLNDSGVLGH